MLRYVQNWTFDTDVYTNKLHKTCFIETEMVIEKYLLGL